MNNCDLIIIQYKHIIKSIILYPRNVCNYITHGLGRSSAAFSSTLTGNWIRTEAAGLKLAPMWNASAHMGCLHDRQQLYSLYHNTGPSKQSLFIYTLMNISVYFLILTNNSAINMSCKYLFELE